MELQAKQSLGQKKVILVFQLAKNGSTTLMYKITVKQNFRSKIYFISKIAQNGSRTFIYKVTEETKF